MDCMNVTGMGAYIRAVREARGMTQSALALRVGTSRAYLSQIESGKVSLANADTRRKLADELGIRHVDLLVAAGELAPDEIAPLPESHIGDFRLQEIIDTWPRMPEGLQRSFFEMFVALVATPGLLDNEEPRVAAVAR
jgi:transcriptional regulator with XRE-family HTH domain